jgi:hypothetical protein
MAEQYFKIKDETYKPARTYKKAKDVAISEDKAEKPRKIGKYMKPIKQARKIKVLDKLPEQPTRDFSERISKIRLRKKREEVKPLTQEEAFRYDQILAQLEKSKEPERYQRAMEQSMAMSGMDKEEEPQEQEEEQEATQSSRRGRPKGTKMTKADYQELLKKAGLKVSGSANEVRNRYEKFLQEQEQPKMRARSASPPLYTKQQKKQQKKLKKQQKKQQKMMEEAESNLQQAPAETPEMTQARNQAIENGIQFFMTNNGITRDEAMEMTLKDINDSNPQTEQDYNEIGSGYLGSGLTKKRSGSLVKKVMKHHQGQLKKIKKHLGRDLEKKDIKKLQKAKFFGSKKLNGAGFTDTLLDLGKKGLKAAVDYGMKNPDKVLGYAKKGFEMGKSILSKKKKGGALQKTSVLDALRNQ